MYETSTSLGDSQNYREWYHHKEHLVYPLLQARQAKSQWSSQPLKTFPSSYTHLQWTGNGSRDTTAETPWRLRGKWNQFSTWPYSLWESNCKNILYIWNSCQVQQENWKEKKQSIILCLFPSYFRHVFVHFILLLVMLINLSCTVQIFIMSSNLVSYWSQWSILWQDMVSDQCLHLWADLRLVPAIA